MAQELIISISGMRGIVGENMYAATATEFGCAFGTFLKQNSAKKDERLSIAIGADTRPSGDMVKSAVIAGICSVGIDVFDLGVVTTPTVGIMLRHLKCDGGIVITASHNPIEYNGIKLLLSDGIAPPKDKAALIKQMYLDKKSSPVASIDCGKVSINGDSDEVHIEKVLACVEAEKIAAKKFKVALDSVNGAGARAAKKLLGQLGCQVAAINDDMSGHFAHTPEPTEANLTQLCQHVKDSKSMVGFAQDPDADRLAVVDENGKYIGEEYTLALAAKYIYSKTTGPAAANLSTSRMIDDIAASANSSVIRTPVGEANVAQQMIKNNCVIGGEGNGGVIDLRVGPVRDSLVSIAMILQLCAESGKTISQLVSEIGIYEMTKQKFAADKTQGDKIIAGAKELFKDVPTNTSDGCRFDFPNGWVHLRMSNTEPIMRLIGEFTDPTVAKKYIDSVMEIQKAVLSED